jgi:hypothetical protein
MESRRDVTALGIVVFLFVLLFIVVPLWVIAFKAGHDLLAEHRATVTNVATKAVPPSINVSVGSNQCGCNNCGCNNNCGCQHPCEKDAGALDD